MHPRAHIEAVGDTTCVPECPSCGRSCAGDLRGVGFEKVEFVEGVVALGSAEEGEEH